MVSTQGLSRLRTVVSTAAWPTWRRERTRSKSSWSGAKSKWLCYFFSSRRRHTRLQGDWSSDVCSSDLDRVQRDLVEPGGKGMAGVGVPLDIPQRFEKHLGRHILCQGLVSNSGIRKAINLRSEERRVGKECRSRWSPYH